jgi:hypothetical protein
LTFRPSDRIHRFTANEAYVVQPADNYSLFAGTPEATGTVTLVANTAVVTPVFFDQPVSIETVGLVVTTAGAGGTVARIALYEWNPVTRALGALVRDCGTVSTAATGLVTASFGNVAVRSGWYAWAVSGDGTPALRTVQVSDPELVESFTVSTTTLVATIHYTAPLTATAAAPAAGPAVTRVTSATEFRPNQLVIGRWSSSRIAF